MESYTRKSINKNVGIVLSGSDGKESACNAGDLGVGQEPVVCSNEDEMWAYGFRYLYAC